MSTCVNVNCYNKVLTEKKKKQFQNCDFKTPKNPSHVPVTWNLEYPPPWAFVVTEKLLRSSGESLQDLSCFTCPLVALCINNHTIVL